MQDKGVSIPVSASHPANAQVAHPHTHATPRTQRPVKATPQPPRHLNLATLQSQIDAATRHITASLPQQHDPHTLIARYYIKSLLLKLQRIGDMNQPTNLTGMPVVKLVIGSDGELQMLTLLQSSGNHKLDQDAMQIAHESSPFAPFPPELKSQTNHITFICYMHFMGYKRLHTEY